MDVPRLTAGSRRASAFDTPVARRRASRQCSGTATSVDSRTPTDRSLQDRRVTSELRGPTEAERRAVQQAVNAGDLKRAESLLSGIRNRLAKSNGKKRPTAQSSPGSQTAKRRQTKGSSKRPKTASDVRVVGTSRFALCPVCRREFSVNRDGRMRAHRKEAPQGKCRGSGVKVAKAWKAVSKGNSIHTVSGGLPGLGKRH